MCNELIVCEAAGLWQAIHAAANFNVYETVVEQWFQHVLRDHVVREHPFWDMQILKS